MGIRPVYEYFMFDGKSSRDFEVWISGDGTFKAPEKDVEIVSVPGRNGDLTIDHNRFFNIDITYPAFITKAFRQNFDAFKAYMLSKTGYKRLEDTYHPEYYRLAQVTKAIEPDMTALNRAGKFNITFNCDPRRFLKSGEKAITFESNGSLRNPTPFYARPLIRVYGTGYIRVGVGVIDILKVDEYVDIDCENQDAYKGNVNCNNNIHLWSEFPRLIDGENAIVFEGPTKIEVTPRWWTI